MRQPAQRLPSSAATVVAAAPAMLLTMPAAASDTPLSYLQSFGPKADRILSLNHLLLGISIAVVVIIAGLTIAGLVARRSRWRDGEIAREQVYRRPTGLAWIVVGVGVSTLALLGAMVSTAYTMAAINEPSVTPKVNIEITGHQWWWGARYLDENPSRIFETANEIHIPVGEPVRFEVKTADVIHSFWVPGLADKIDLIPNQKNTTWFEAREPGTYRGQCAEYCGLQHAHMGLLVVAEPRKDFEAWQAKQLTPAEVKSGDIASAESTFVMRCGACHAVRGTRAAGRLGPDLSHLMTRKTVAAGTLPNTSAYLSAWIADPQSIKPGAMMPRLTLTGPEIADVRNFLETLK